MVKNEPAISAAVSNIRLGDLMVEAGILSAQQLREALDMIKATGLPLGRVLAMAAIIDENQLHAVVQCQSFLKDQLIDIDLAKNALSLASNKKVTFNQALEELGWINEEDVSPIKLGNILLQCGFVTEAQLNAALEQSNKSGLPFGRVLVLSGVITESLMMSALNTHTLLRESKIVMEQAIDTLNAAHDRRPVSEPVPERDFYELPSRGVRIGELLVLAGILSESQLASAVEVGLLNKKVIGDVLRDLKLVPAPILEAALQVQEMVSKKMLKVLSASSVLTLMHHSEMSLTQALAHLQKKQTESSAEISLTNFLKQVSRLQDSDIDFAVEAAKQNASLLGKMLVAAGVLDEKTLSEASLCCLLIEQRALPLEQACIAFDFSQRKGITVTEALRELSWSRCVEGDTLALPNLKEMRDEYWERCVDEASTALKAGAPNAEELIKKLLGMVTALPHPELQTARVFEMLAELRAAQENYADAEVQYRKALELRRMILGPTHDTVGTLLNHLARVCYHQRKYDEALELCERFVRMGKSKLGSDHPNVACGLNNLASIYHVQKNYEEAANAYRESLRICQKSLGQAHPTTLRLMRTYAGLLREMNREDEAKDLDLKATGFFTGSWKTVPKIEKLSADLDPPRAATHDRD